MKELKSLHADTYDFTIETLGKCRVDSPIAFSNTFGDGIVNFIDEREVRIVVENSFSPDKAIEASASKAVHMMEKAGPRAKLFFNPAHVHAAIVTSGGLCPGLNDIIRSIVRTLWNSYGVRRISGIKYGYTGFISSDPDSIVKLDPKIVDDIHKIGGSILGSARGGGREVEKIVDALESMNINILFITGGDGSQRGAQDIGTEVQKRGLKISIIGIPKTIDNDICFISKTFGFDTAVSIASQAVHAAHVEAASAINGIGLVKLMGRHSGFIATHTAIATHEANFVLIPEVRFDLEGPKGFLRALEDRLKRRQHAVILVAEGAGQEFLNKTNKKDAGGNIKLADIGSFIREEIIKFMQKEKMEINLKYIDPSYIIRASVAIPNDAFYCSRLGTNAVHAAMAGKTKMLLSFWNNAYTHIPIAVGVSKRNTVGPESSLWRDVIEATSQPISMKN